MPTFGSLKAKDLVGIPWMVAFALRADGWYLRSDIIWSKPNPMPESVTDRPTKSHEYLFLLSKSARYFWDADAVREALDPANVAHHDRYSVNGIVGKGRNPNRMDGGGTTQGGVGYNPAGRNLRSVWTIATQPYPGAHFATFPRKLVEPCIKAGTSERGVCPECGAPWERVVERERAREGATPAFRDVAEAGNSALASLPSRLRTDASRSGMGTPSVETTGWRPTCRHDDPDGTMEVQRKDGTTEIVPTWSEAFTTAPATVLDCFAGSGTTGMVAQSLSRRAVLIDLSMDYLGQLMERNRDVPLGLGA